MDLDQLPFQVQLDRGRVTPGPQRPADQVVVDRVDRLVDFDVEVAVHFADRTRSARRTASAGRGKSSGSSSARNASRGRHWVVPWMRRPAVVLHQVSAAPGSRPGR